MTNPVIPNLSDPLATFTYALARYNAMLTYGEEDGLDPDDSDALVLTDAEIQLFAGRVGEDLDPSELHQIWLDAGLAITERNTRIVPGHLYAVQDVLAVARKFYRQQSVFVEAGHLLQRCLEQALVFPERHSQSTWFMLDVTTDGDGNPSLCGSTGCLAGHAVILGSEYVPVVNARYLSTYGDYTVGVVRPEEGDFETDPGELAEDLLALTSDEADEMFEPSRTLDELWKLGEAFYPGLVSRELAESHREAIVAAGPQLRITRVALDDNGVVDAADVLNYEGGEI